MATELTRTRRFALAAAIFYALFAVVNAVLLALDVTVDRWEPRNLLNVVLLIGFGAAAVHRWRRVPARGSPEGT